MTALAPRTETELAEIVADAYAADRPMAIVGRGTKSGWGRAVDHPVALSLAGFSGIVDYAPAELVLTAGAGTPLTEIQAALAAEGQHLAFEPVDCGPIFGHQSDRATIGGVLACNLSGSRRPFAGAARDFFLGFHAVNGRGEIFKAGGKVVKNVTGYDLPKLMAGSFGTLALMTEITIKVVPAPETTLTLVIPGLDVVAANRVMTAALASTADPSGAAFLPAPLTPGLASGLEADRSATLLRLEGSPASVAYRRQALEALAACPVTVLGQDESTGLWCTLGRLLPLLEAPDQAIWLLSVPPASGAAVVETLARTMTDMRYFLDWGGGRIWLSVPVETVGAAAQAANVRAALSLGGHASLLRAPDNCRRGDDVFSAEAPLDLLHGIRTAFDPKGLFNRGRLHSGL